MKFLVRRKLRHFLIIVFLNISLGFFFKLRVYFRFSIVARVSLVVSVSLINCIEKMESDE